MSTSTDDVHRHLHARRDFLYPLFISRTFRAEAFHVVSIDFYLSVYIVLFHNLLLDY